MAGIRRDRKGRLLRTGEQQRADGRYEYRYLDHTGKTRSVYSWRLVDTDQTPMGKRNSASLREQEKAISEPLFAGIDLFSARRMPLNHYFDLYLVSKRGLKPTTYGNYSYIYNRYVRPGVGALPIGSIKYSTVVRFYTALILEDGLSIGTLSVIHNLLHPAFTLAVRDDVIRRNPSDGAYADVKKTCVLVLKKRHPLAEAEQAAFLDYMARTKRFQYLLPLFTVMLGTGCRIGEIAGLRWSDCDFENGIITIDHTASLVRRPGGGYERRITTTKTKCGTRRIPMLSAVKKTLLEEKARQMDVNGQNTPVIDGYSDFVFRSRHGNLISHSTVNAALRQIVESYNQNEREKAKVEDREPFVLPPISCHVFRHTFCARFCENETDLKVIQEIMGHSDITTTMNIYYKASDKKKRESFGNLEERIKIY